MSSTAPHRSRPATDIALIAVFAAFIAVCSIIPGFNVGPVPITLQTLAVMLAGAVLGSTRGMLASLLYIAVGLVGVPVFAGGTAGFGVFARPSIGYLLAFPLAAWLIGFIVERLPRTPKTQASAGADPRPDSDPAGRAGRRTAWRALGIFGAVLAGNLVFIWPLGILGMWWRVPFDTLGQAFVANLAFIPGDLIKAVVATIVASYVHRAFPQLLPARRSTRSIQPEVSPAPADQS